MTQPSRRKGGLGRGLASLIPTGPADGGPRMGDAAADAVFGGGPIDVDNVGAIYREIEPSAIEPNPRQPRQVFDEEALAELVHSIREFGLMQPIVVRAIPDTAPGAPARYQLVMGERRWRAAQQAGLTTIPAIVRETAEDNLLRDALLENIHRAQLNPLEEAAAYQQLLEEFDGTHDELAVRIGRSRPVITNMIRLLRLPIAVQRRVAAGVLSAGHARALLALEAGPEAQEELATRIVAEGMSVRATEEAVTLGVEVKAPKKGSVRPGGRTAALDDLSARLGDHLDTRVGVQLGRAKGKITIDFATVEDLDRIVHLINPKDPGVFGSK